MSLASSSGCIVRVGTTAPVESPSAGVGRRSSPLVLQFHVALAGSKCGNLCRVCRVRIGHRSGRRWSLRAIRVLQQPRNQIHVAVGNAAPTTTVEIPVSCYQIVGVPNQAEKDEIVKSVIVLKNADVEEGYTMETVRSRQDLLMDVRDKLLFEPEYAGNVKEKIPPKSSLRIPWAWLPGALCLLQEVGEEKLVLDIGRRALQHPDAKPYIHDLILSMALAECAIAKIGFEKNKVSDGFEALARAQCLLRSKMSLGKMALLSQIEQSLEELAPACTLELLGMPYIPENAERRQGAIAALRELLRQGLDVEASCQVQDWPCFLSQALNRLMAAEIIELLSWDNLAVTRKNKKSLESQNQRVVIDFNCFYLVLIAHIALGFLSKQMELINKAKVICECLIASEGIDLKFEEALCSFFLGQSDQAEAVERLWQLQSSSNTASRNSIPGKEIKDSSSGKTSLELWLKEAVLHIFPDTRDCSPSLASFFGAEKTTPHNRQTKGALQTIRSVNHRPISTAHASDRRDIEEPLSYINSTRHLGPAVKQLTPADLQSPLILGKNNNENDINPPSVQLKRNIGAYHRKVWENWLFNGDIVSGVTLVAILGCLVLMTFKLIGVKCGRIRTTSRWAFHKPVAQTSSLAQKTDPSLDCRSTITEKLKKLLLKVTEHPRNLSDAGNLQSSSLAANPPSSVTVYRHPMPVQEAEMLVKQWQATKAQALGPSHQVDSLSEVLDDSMLVQWQALADAARRKSCFWRFVLLHLSVIRADILSDGTGTDTEMAEIEALLEEAAELVDESKPKNPNYCSTYKVRYLLRRHDDGSWRFCEGDIQIPS